jgi:hypothetical protein
MDECHTEIKKFQDLQSKILYEQESIAKRQLELKELDIKDQVPDISYHPSILVSLEASFLSISN